MKYADLQPGDIFSFARASELHIKVNSGYDKIYVFLRMRDGLLLQDSWSGPLEIIFHSSASSLLKEEKRKTETLGPDEPLYDYSVGCH